jgi:hypothetical protein
MEKHIGKLPMLLESLGCDGRLAFDEIGDVDGAELGFSICAGENPDRAKRLW